MPRTIGLVFALMLICAPAWCAVNVNCSGSYADIVDRNDLQGGGGSNLNSDYESGSSAGLVSVSGAPGATAWRINVRRTDTAWNPGLSLWIRRTTPLGAYQLIGLTDSLFLNGTGHTNNIPFQVKVTGVSITLPLAMYTNSIVFTVVSP
jgi:hypothetical protein